MFAIRQAKVDDIPTLLKLAKMVHFTNLPADREVIYTKIMHSRESFLRAAGGGDAGVQELREQEAQRANGQLSGQLQGLSAATRTGDLFMFVLEDTNTGACLGTSQIIARMGGPGNPNFSWKLERREFFSKTLQTGTSHIVAHLYADETGPTEIGGLILQPASRGAKLGRFLSQIRFHVIGLHRELFSDRTIAEMMAPLTLDGQSMLWEYLGRRFIPLSYAEADKACQYSREFIASLLPKEPIYLSLLPPEARDVIGRVGDETVAARRLLEKLGFKYTDMIDPFDGGPHLIAATDEIPVVKSTRTLELGSPVPASQATTRAFLSTLTAEGEFCAIEADVAIEKRSVSLTRQVMTDIGWEPGISVGVTPLEDSPRKTPTRKVRKVKQ